MDESELYKKLLETFRIEANEHIGIIGKGLVELEKENAKENRNVLLEEVYRSAHSMKGAARAVNLYEVERLCQSLESCFSLVKKGELEMSPSVFDIFHNVVNTVELFMSEDEEDKPEALIVQYFVDLMANIKKYQQNETDTTSEIKKEQEISKSTLDIEKIQQEKIEPIVPSLNKKMDVAEPNEKEPIVAEELVDEVSINPNAPKSINTAHDTIRIPTKKVDEIYLLAEETLQIKLSHSEELSKIKESESELVLLKENWSKLYSMQLRNAQMNRRNGDTVANREFEMFEMVNANIRNIDRKLATLHDAALYVSSTTQNTLDNLVEDIKHILMLPFSNLLNNYPRLVRDLAKDMGKEVELNITGAEVEVDRRIMQELKDPLLHVIRNAIDHGIEKAVVRENANKPRKGSIHISISQYDANNVQISVADDGAGINRKELLAKAIRQKAITKSDAQKLSDNEIDKLIFNSGISTASIITDISGRGLGMAIVEEKVENLGGRVSIESSMGKGCTLLINVPTSISKSQGLLVMLNQQKYILPVSNITETLRIKTSNIKKVENQDTIQYNQSTLPLVRLGDVLEVAQKKVENEQNQFIVVVESLNHKIGFVVDDIENEQEVLFKNLNYPIIKLKNVAGVSLLGTGEVCPILNNQDLIRSAIQLRPSVSATKKSKNQQVDKKNILFAEDSITSRLFIKNILEAAGYRVKAVIDGKAAFTALKQDRYDLLVSDVEMPRMNGFELTQAVRNDNTLSELPIVLVTSLNKSEDQERGIEAGANAYIIKGSFEQSNLLEVIKRLI